jgi:2-C-methyl-D-erythritol 4-phosphate cytidylyltransferase
VWDAPGEAVQFFETYTDYLTRRGLGVPKLTLNEPGRRVWEYAGRATLLARAGDQVLIILAPDRAVLDRVKNLFPEF